MVVMPDYYFQIITFILGACIGSFLNVVIYRLPRSLAPHRPSRSFCPACKNSIASYDNIPILSYLILRGRCRNCQARIAIRYPIIELLSGVLALCCYIKFGLTLEALIYYAFIACLVTITFIDIDHQIIPDSISLPGIPIFGAAAYFASLLPLKDILLGILIGGGILYLVAWGYHLFTRREGMGGGDIKLLAMTGALIGWQGVIFTIFVSSVLGSVIGLIVMLINKKGMKLAIPFGPFLALGALLYLFFGTELIYWYFHLLR
jgi:leader peptidase (prepilin peptidase)/N-methyltransferase